jgi:RNA polymerase sigma-70 factor (ECF subfamily)
VASRDRSDEEILAEIQGSEHPDSTMFETLVERHQERVLANCRYMTRSAADAEDVAQEVFVKAYFGLRRFEGRSSFRTWIQRIKINHCLSFIEKRKARVFTSLDEPGLERATELQVPPRAERQVIAASSRERIGAILDSMADTLRLPLLMRDLDGLTYEEIAEHLSIGLSAVKMRIKRGREEFQRRWSAQEQPTSADAARPSAQGDASGG